MEIDTNLIEEFKQTDRDKLEFSKKCIRLAQEITSGHMSIVKLVEDLGVLLVDVSPNNRELGTWILTDVLDQLSPIFLDSKQLTFLCAFYADRLKDHHQVIPAVFCGILALAKFEQFPDGDCTKILAALFQHVACQQQQEQDRLKIYKIFDVFLEKHSTELCTMGLDFVYGVLSAVDGERNPKNLIFLFTWFPKFLKTVNLGHLSEEVFEVLACYFPVDFKTPSQDPNAITREVLADALAVCLTATPKFAEFCFPLAFEKFDSSLEIAKIDALKLLEMGCMTFDTTSYVQHATEMWSQLQKELFYGNLRINVEEACLKTLRDIINKISDDSSLNSIVKDITDTLKGNLLPDSKLFDCSAKLLLNVAKASKKSSFLVTREIAPILINMYNIASTPGNKIVILRVLVEFFASYVGFYQQIEIDDLNTVPVLCLKGSIDGTSNELRKESYECLGRISKYLTLEVRLPLYDNLKHLLLITEPKEIRDRILNCFKKISYDYPSEIKEKVIDSVIITNCQSLGLYLDALCVVASNHYFTKHIINIFLIYLNQEPTLGQISIHSLRKMLEKYEHNDEITSALAEKNIITVLIDWCSVNQQSLDDSAIILKIVIGKQDSQRQRQILQQEVPKILEFSNAKNIFLLDGVMCRLKRDVEIDFRIFNNLVNFIEKESDSVVQNVAVQLLANLVNKCSDDRVLNIFLSELEERQINLTIEAWITKALVMRNHPLATNWIYKLVEQLKTDKKLAKSFQIIINDNFDNLSDKSHCVKTLFYQQKFFTLVSNKFLEGYRPEYKSFLTATGYLLEHVPKQAILLQFKKILKLIILCLDECEENEVLTVLLQLIRDFMATKEQCVEDNFSDFLSRFLKLSSYDKSMRVRILALQCLQDCTYSFPLYKLLPYKSTVLIGLGKVIDDKKRIVRKEAVEARSLWYILDAPI